MLQFKNKIVLLLDWQMKLKYLLNEKVGTTTPELKFINDVRVNNLNILIELSYELNIVNWKSIKKKYKFKKQELYSKIQYY